MPTHTLRGMWGYKYQYMDSAQEKEDAYMCEDCQNKRRRKGHCKKMLPLDAFDRGPNRHPNLKDHDPVALCDQCERKQKKH